MMELTRMVTNRGRKELAIPIVSTADGLVLRFFVCKCWKIADQVSTFFDNVV